MKKGVFREVSLQRLSSPEQLDQLMSVTSPRAWLSLLGIIAILLTAIIWGIFGSIPNKTTGEGILIKSGGVYNISHNRGGQITDIRVEAGDIVKKGDVVARIDQHELVEQISVMEEQLLQIKSFQVEMVSEYDDKPSSALQQLYELARSIQQAQSAVEVHRTQYERVLAGPNVHELGKLRLQLEQAKLNVTTQEKEVERLSILVEGGAVAKNDYNAALASLEQSRLQVLLVQESIAELETSEKERSAATLKAQLLQSELTANLLVEQLAEAKQMKEKEMQEQIDKLRTELEFGSAIVSPSDGRILEVMVSRGDLIQAGMQLVSIEREGDTLRDLEVALYVAAEEGKQITPGMMAQISPTTVKKEEYGFMIGRVISVSEFPATTQGMMVTLGSQELVARLSRSSAPIEVRVELITESSTVSGYKWSSPNGPPITIDSGTLCDGTVTISSQPPIRLVIPRVKKFIMGY